MDLLHHIWVFVATQGGYGGFHMLFDLRCQMHIATMLHKHGGVGNGKGIRVLMNTGGNMDNVHLSVQNLSHGNALLDGITAFHQLGSAHAVFNGKVGTAGLPDFLNNQ